DQRRVLHRVRIKCERARADPLIDAGGTRRARSSSTRNVTANGSEVEAEPGNPEKIPTHDRRGNVSERPRDDDVISGCQPRVRRGRNPWIFTGGTNHTIVGEMGSAEREGLGRVVGVDWRCEDPDVRMRNLPVYGGLLLLGPGAGRDREAAGC